MILSAKICKKKNEKTPSKEKCAQTSVHCLSFASYHVRHVIWGRASISISTAFPISRFTLTLIFEYDLQDRFIFRMVSI